jgi:hypothetical protein
MIGCDSCKEPAISVLSVVFLGEQAPVKAWCGRRDCLTKILVQVREIIEPYSRKILSALEEPVKEDKA